MSIFTLSVRPTMTKEIDEISMEDFFVCYDTSLKLTGCLTSHQIDSNMEFLREALLYKLVILSRVFLLIKDHFVLNYSLRYI